MKILILGADGYLGWPTCMHMIKNGFDVTCIDNYSKRKIELNMNVSPIKSIKTLEDKVKIWNKNFDKKINFLIGDLCNHKFIYYLLEKTKPDAIIHYAEQPSAPFSMHTREHAYFTQYNNVFGNLNLLFAMKKYTPDAHLIKLGTMGEYGTPNIKIEEGWLNIEHEGRKERVLFPKRPGSFYHLSKVFDSYNIEFCCRNWGFASTDLNQGVVYGIETDETILHPDFNTSFHYDEIFGTVLNRFVTQAISNINLTVYGEGKQIRSFLNIKDTMKCIKIAVENPANKSEFRVFNQFTETFSINELAKLVSNTSNKLGFNTNIERIKNPRNEMSEHFYNPTNSSLNSLGLKPIRLTEDFLIELMNKLDQYKINIDKDKIQPSIKW